MNIETLNNVIGNTLNRVIEKAIDSIGALPVGSKYKLFGSNPFTLLVQRTAFGDYPEVIFQDIKTGKDFFILKDISKKSKQDFKSKLFRHINSTSEIVQNIANEKPNSIINFKSYQASDLKDKYFKKVNTTVNKFVNNIISELKAEKKGKKATPKKKTTPKKQTIKKTVKAKPKKVSSSIETCSDAGRLLRVKKSSSAGRKLAICRWK